MSPSRETTLEVSLPATRMQNAPIIRPCRKFKGHTSWVKCVLHLPGGQQIMTCSYDGSLRVWNLKTGRQISVWPMKEFSAWSIALSPNGKKVAIGGWGGPLNLYDVDTEKVTATSGQFGYPSMSVGWSGDGRRVVSTGNIDWDRDDDPPSRSMVRVWDLESENTVLEIQTGISLLESTIYSSDMTMIAASGGKFDRRSESSKDIFIKIWYANTGKLVANLKGHTGAVYCLAWTADGSTLISGSFDRSIRTWDTSTWQQITVLTAHPSAICGIAIHPTAHILASASWDNTARLWNLENGQPIGPPLQHEKLVCCVSFSTDGNILATGCGDNNAYTWDISSILSDAGLVLNPNDDHHQSLLDTDATQLVRQRQENSTYRLHPDFFQEIPRHPDLLRSSRILPTSARYETPSQSRFPAWAQNTFFHWSHRRNDRGTELHERLPTAVDVSLGQRKHMYYSANELRIKEEKEKEKRKRKARAAKNPSASTAIQPPGGVRHAQPSEMHTSASVSSSTPVVIGAPAATTSATSLTNEIIPQVGCWTRFICCS